VHARYFFFLSARDIGERDANGALAARGKPPGHAKLGGRGRDTAWRPCVGTSPTSSSCGKPCSGCAQSSGMDCSGATKIPSDLSAMFTWKHVEQAHERLAGRRLDGVVCRLLTSSTARIFSASLSLPIQRSLRRCLSVRSSANWSVATSGSLLWASIGLIDTLLKTFFGWRRPLRRMEPASSITSELVAETDCARQSRLRFADVVRIRSENVRTIRYACPGIVP
jgi:hypothetical protein